jgi:hypothetical protein
MDFEDIRRLKGERVALFTKTVIFYEMQNEVFVVIRVT